MTRLNSLSSLIDDQSILMIAQLSIGTRRNSDDSRVVQQDTISSTNVIVTEIPKPKSSHGERTTSFADREPRIEKLR